MKKIFLLLFGLLSLTACENIAEDERFEGPLSIAINKNVLIEDFTGQLCKNCPRAAQKAHDLQAMYGAETVIVVGIHGGSLSIPDQSPIGLATNDGKSYVSHWNVSSFPKGLVDRAGGLLDYEKWSASTVKRLQMQPAVELEVKQLSFDETTRTVSGTIHVASKGVTVGGQLQIWLTESNISALQYLPDGSEDEHYTHQHVFRANLTNDLLGQPLALGAQSEADVDFSYVLAKPAWKPENMSLVTFFWNEEAGVMQVVDAAL